MAEGAMGSRLAGLLGLRPNDGGSSVALRASLDRAEDAIGACRARIADLAARRGAVLLDGTAAEAEAQETELGMQEREAARLAALIAELGPRLAAAEAAEEARRLDALSAKVEAEAQRGAGLIPEIVQAAECLAALVAEHDALAGAVTVANRTLHAAGRGRIPLPTARAWPNDPLGQRVNLLGQGMRLPGPRGECLTVEVLRQEIKRVTAATIR